MLREILCSCIVFVGIRVAAMHTQLGEEEAQEHTTQK